MNSVISKSMGDRRKKVLDLYKQCYRISKSWKGSNEEKKYIVEEAKRLFHKNKHIKDKNVIDIKIFEAESRMQLGEHYKNPYPRIYHSINVSGDDVGKKLIVPAYMDSYYDESHREDVLHLDESYKPPHEDPNEEF